MARGWKCHGRWAATQRDLVFGQAVFLPSPLPLPLARFFNRQPGPDLPARIQDDDLITNSGFFDHPTACVQAISAALLPIKYTSSLYTSSLFVLIMRA